MAGNFGIGLGSFMSGLAQGSNAVNTLQANSDARKMRKIQIDEATAAASDRAQTRADQQQQRDIASQGIAEGQAMYGDDVNKVVDHFYSKVIPKQQQALLSAGKPEAADMLGKFMETNQAKQITQNAAQAIKFASIGDYNNLGPSIENILNLSSQVTGGDTYKLKGMKELTNDKGVKTGGVSFTVTGSDGKDQDVTFNNSGELVSFIRNNAMPDKIVEYAYDQDQQAKKIAADTAKRKQEHEQKIAEETLKYGLNIKRDELQSGLKQEEERNKVQLENAYGLGSRSQVNNKVASAQAAANFLAENGYSPEMIRQSLPALLGIQNNTKAPSVRIEETVKMLANNDISFGRLSPQEQVAKAKEFIATVDSQSGSGADTSGAINNPFSSGANKPQGTGKTPYFDSKTNTIIYR